MAQKRFVQLCWSLVLHECAHGLNLDFLTKHNSEAAVGNEDEFFELIDGEEEEGEAAEGRQFINVVTIAAFNSTLLQLGTDDSH